MVCKEFDLLGLNINYTDKPYLIEASAGTGKTFSIASLVLRIILEKDNADIKKILILTFTNAATNELRIRVRKFLNEAWNFLEYGDGEVDGVIKDIVTKAIEGKGEKEIKQIKNGLRLAMLEIDEAPIYTIHSFCQRMLTDFAFETGMSPDFDVLPDESALLNNILLKFWREYVNMQNAKYDVRNMLGEMNAFFGKNDFSINNLWALLSDSVRKYLSGRELALPEGFEDNQLFEMLKEANVYVKKKIDDFKKKYGLVSYNDMIKMLHDSVHNKEELAEKIKEKFDFVFVDEFQDTDNLQYEIFKKVFEREVPVFYIGDPKQSIYSFRGADIYTYMEAKKNAECRKMKMNFRSSKELIADLNALFGSLKEEDRENLGFEYSDVNAKKELDYNVDGEKRGIYVHKVTSEGKNYATQKDLKDETPEIVKYLVSKGEIEVENENGNKEKRKIKYSDIAILVRYNRDAKELKTQLSKSAIPAVVVDETPVLKTSEAKELFFVLRAVSNPSDVNINTALATSLVGSIDYETILKAEKEKFVEVFGQIKEVWNNEGVFPAIIKFMSAFGIWNKSGSESDVDRERKITNVLHIAEILNDKEINLQYGMLDLLNWFGKTINDDEAVGEGYELRMESDKSAVKIVTIHKSKGLEYPVVLLPMMNLTHAIDARKKIIEFYDRGAKKWKYSLFRNSDYKNLAESELEKENMRLFYVAMTRAKYFNFIFYYDVSRNKQKSLFRFFKGYFVGNKFDVNFSGAGTNQASETEERGEVKEFYGETKQVWGVTSYSALDEHTHEVVAAMSEGLNLTGYDKFIFEDLPKGASVGNILHKIFEEVDFSNPEEYWKSEKKDILLKTLDLREEGYLKQMVNNVLDANFHEGINLRKADNVFKELEFYFSFNSLDRGKINTLFEKYSVPAVITEADAQQGVIHGFIDLVFEYDGKVYILDWKSNHLGYSLDDYNAESLKVAMEINNYYLQYYIYSLAMYRYLGEERFKNNFGGVYYVFLRGVRAKKHTGIFYTKPDFDLIKEFDDMIM